MSASRLLRSAVLAGVVYGILTAALVEAGARWWMPGAIDGPVAEGAWTARSRALFAVKGFHPAEFDATAERHFSWTGSTAELIFPRLDRSRPVPVTLSVRGGRPEGSAPVRLRIAVDGELRAVADIPPGAARVEFDLPASGGTGAVVTLDVADVFVPGGSDPRTLGIIVDRVAAGGEGTAVRPSWGALVQVGAAVGALAMALWLCGLAGLAAHTTAACVGIATAWLVTEDGAFAGVFVDRLLSLGGGALAISLLVAALRAKWPTVGGVAGWSAAAAVALAVAFVKLAVVWHPLAIVGDGLFQVHRAQAVHAGHFFFTSITPKPFFEFPYPVALYVSALPFWSWFPGELDLLRLLRAVTLGAEAVAGVALFVAVRRQWPASAAAWFVPILWPLSRAPFEALSNANLTNLFGQAVFGAAIAVAAWMAASGRPGWRASILLGAALTVAWLSHFGTLTVGIILVGSMIGSLILFGRGYVRRVGAAVALIALLSAGAAWMAYYSHPTFRDVYRQTYERVRAPEQDDSSKLLASPAVKWQRWWDGVGDDYGRPGVPVLIASLIGLVMICQRRPRDGAGLVFLTWIAVWVGLSVLGLLTPLTFRANLATAPAFAVVSALAVGSLAGRGRVGVILAALATAVLAWDGWQLALHCLRLA